MLRITGANVAVGLHGVGKDGFADPNPGVTAATVVTATFLNSIQEEILTVIEGSGIAPSATNTQLASIIAAMRSYATYSITGTGVALSSLFSLTETSDNGGFAIAANVVTFPAAGTYQVSVNAYLTSTSTANPEWMVVRVKIGVSTTRDVLGTRFTASPAGFAVPCVATHIIEIADPVTDTLSLTWEGTGAGTTAYSSRMSISRIR